MTLRTSEAQTDALRRQAEQEGRSMQAVALAAIDEYISRHQHKSKVGDVVRRVVEQESGVLDRLRDA